MPDQHEAFGVKPFFWSSFVQSLRELSEQWLCKGYVNLIALQKLIAKIVSARRDEEFLSRTSERQLRDIGLDRVECCGFVHFVPLDKQDS